jgi:hypothetical protein
MEISIVFKASDQKLVTEVRWIRKVYHGREICEGSQNEGLLLDEDHLGRKALIQNALVFLFKLDVF